MLALDLSGRVVLVTGGSRGVGRGIARAFLAAGATVVTCARTAADPPTGASHRICDVRDQAAVAALMDGIVAEHGHLDVLVNNAGGSPYAPAAEASARLHARIVELNLLAPLLIGQAAQRVMGEYGAIVNVSSVSARRPSPGTAAYGAAKAGLDSLTRSLAVEWAPRIRVNAIDVGMVRTEEIDEHYGGPAGVEAIARTVPLGRLATPYDVGTAAVFLASDLASYITGATLELHGGGEPPAYLTALDQLQRPKESQ
jgi:NAD(P)-dependent dehydrogenase (short-subunit alcohol dehydrogenase family)